LGAGDVKLMAMSGAFLGTPQVLLAVLFSMAAGGAVAFAYALHRRAAGQVLANVRDTLIANAFAMSAGQQPTPLAAPSIGKFPYAIAICLGTLAWVATTWL